MLGKLVKLALTTRQELEEGTVLRDPPHAELQSAAIDLFIKVQRTLVHTE